MQSVRSRETLTAASVTVSALVLCGPAMAGWVTTEIETSRAHCGQVCEGYPPSQCTARFVPHQANGDYGQCHTVVLTTDTPGGNEAANPSNSVGGNPAAGSGGAGYLTEESDEDYNRRIREGLVGPDTGQSSGNDLLGQ